MIERRNLAPSFRNYIDARGFQVGFNGLAGGNSPTGGFKYFVPGANVGGDGSSWDAPFTSLTTALAAMQDWDTLFCGPGNNSGNHITPMNADAAFCSLIGMRATSLGLAAWAGATDQALPILQVKARGWRVSGFEFDNPTTSNTVSAGIQIYDKGDGLTRGSYLEVDHCLFTGGKAGIRYRDAGTYVHIHDNQFDLMAGTNGDGRDGAICSASSSYALGGRWLIENNIFAEVVNQINIAGGTRGLNSSVIKGNIFQVDAQANTGVVLIDLRGGGAGNLIIDNKFGCTEAQYGNGTFIRTNANDEGMGNWAADGPCQLEIEH